MKKIFRSAFIVIILLILTSEYLQWRFTPAHYTIPIQTHPVIIVLGLPDCNFLLKAIQHWRVDMALELCKQYDCSHIIFSGGNPSGGNAEAPEMAEYAISTGYNDHHEILEDHSNTTWENIANSTKLISDSSTVIIVSDAMHADRALSYFKQQYPDSNMIVHTADTYRFMDHFWLKTPCSLVECLKWLRDRMRYK